MTKFSIADVARAFEVLRALRDVQGIEYDPNDDPLHPKWVKVLEDALQDMTDSYIATIQVLNKE
jgi:hypothetical protein